MVELGRVGMTCEVSMMPSHMMLPRVGHLSDMFHIFVDLKILHNKEIGFDPSIPDENVNIFRSQDWEVTDYFDVNEEPPLNTLHPIGMVYLMTAYVDSDHI